MSWKLRTGLGAIYLLPLRAVGTLHFGLLRLSKTWLGQDSFARKVRRYFMQCRPGCGACCISPSISSAIPGMPNGKAAGERCVNLSADDRCNIFGQADRPAVCSLFSADSAVCGSSREEAIRLLEWLEAATAVVS